MFSSLISPCEVKLHLLANVPILRPPPATAHAEDAPPTSVDEVVRGLVELSVPHARHIAGIRVRLRGVQTVGLLPDARDAANPLIGFQPIAWEDTVFMEKVVAIGFGAPAAGANGAAAASGSRSNSVSVNGAGSGREERGRARSRRTSPVVSRRSSPAPGGQSTPPGTAAGDGSHHQSGIAAISAAFARAVSRSRPGSRPPSAPNSRPASRASSPTRGSSSHPAPPSRENSAASAFSVSPLPSPGESPVQHDARLASHRAASRPPPLAAPAYEEEEGGAAAGGSTLSTRTSRLSLDRHASNVSSSETHARGRAMLGSAARTTSPSRVASQPPVALEERGPRGSGGRGGVAAGGPRSVSVGWPFSRGARSASRGAAARNGRSGTPGPSAAGRRAPSVDIAALPEDEDEQGEGIELAKGVHGFEFAFILPADSPSYERSPYGRVRYVIKATAYGAGRARSNVEAWRDVFPVVNPSPDGGPTPLTVLYNDIHPTLGLVSIACTSNNISIGGVFNIDIHSPTPPPDLVVYLVRVSLETQIELRSRRKGKQQVPVQKLKMWEKGWVPPRPKDPHGPGDGKKSEGSVRDPSRPGASAEDAWSVQGIARMPHDNQTRASTVAGSKSAMRFSHQLLVEIVHSRAPEPGETERKLKVFALRQPVLIPSCCVAFDAVTLPVYTPEDTGRSASMPYDVFSETSGARAQPGWINTGLAVNAATQEGCVCGQSMQDLQEREQAMIPYAREDAPLDGLRCHGKIGEYEPVGVGTALARSTSRSSNRSARSASTTRRSVSRSLSRAAAGGGFARTPSVAREPQLNGSEGVIRTMSRGSRAQEVPGGEDLAGAPPAYGVAVLEEGEEARGRAAERA